MRKSLIYIIAILTLVLAACTQENTGDKEKEDVNGDGETEENIDQEKEDDEQENDENEGLEEEPEDIEETEPLYELNGAWGFNPISDADPEVVLLTIDDAPDKHALEMAKTLKELDAPAIFFVNGHFLTTDEEKEILKEIHDMGFAIGNHTKTHADLQQLSEEEQREEIMFVSDTVEEIIGERPIFFRAPYGQNTDFSRQTVADDGMLLMNWSFGYDWEKQYMSKDAIADIMVNTEFLGNGANLLMHDREWTAAALKDIVEGLRAKGYGFIDPDTIQGVDE